MKSLKKLKEDGLPVATAESIGLVIEDKTGENNEELQLTITAAAEYFDTFTSPTGKCPMCDSDYGGIFGTFTWGMAHGEGHCSNCKYPFRAHHDIKNVGRLTNLLLPYHPKVL